MSESLYSTSEVARLFEINRVTIYRWVQEGVVKAYKIGKQLKIPASEVERLCKEFGFPEVSPRNIADSSKKNDSFDTVNTGLKHENQKKIVMVIEHDEEELIVIREIFAGTTLKDECRLVTYRDTLEAALAIGKEKPDLLLIKIMEQEENGAEFARKIGSIHSDIKIIFVGASSMKRNIDKRGKHGAPENMSSTVMRGELYREIVKALGLHGGD